MIGVARVAVAALALAGCSAAGAAGDDGTSFVAGDGTITLVAPEQRDEPVDFDADVLGGGRLRLAGLRGQVVVLNVWGSWCAPCREEAPDLVAAAEELEGTATFVGINTRDNDAAALRYEEEFGIPYDSVVDRGGRVLLQLGGAAPANAIPTTLVVDAEGRVAARATGAVDRATLVGLVEDVAEDAGG